MALTDIHFSEGNIQNFILEIGLGALHAPVDMLIEKGEMSLLSEIPSGENIFIISE